MLRDNELHSSSRLSRFQGEQHLLNSTAPGRRKHAPHHLDDNAIDIESVCCTTWVRCGEVPHRAIRLSQC